MNRFSSSLGPDHQQQVDIGIVIAVLVGGLVVLGLMAVIATAVLGAP